MRRNLYASATSGQLISPSTGTSNGGSATVSYTYKAAVWSANTAAASNWGNFQVQYGSSATGPWTTFATVTNETQLGNACISKSHTVTLPAGATFIRFNASYTSGDYFLNFDNVVVSQGAAPSCAAPTALNSLNITETSAQIAWTAGAAGQSYQYSFSTTNTAPTGAGTATTSLFANLSGLSAGSTYYYWVRANCGGSGFSPWSSGSFTTLLPGDNCSNAINLATLTSPITATTVGYANDIATCRTGYADRVYYIDVVNGSTITFQELSNNYDEWEYIGYGSNCSATTQIQCWDNDGLAATTWTNTTGSTQRVWYVQDAYSGSGTFTLSWTVAAPCTPTGDQNTYGTASWNGYVYNSASAGQFTTYKGYVTESEIFDRDFTTNAPTGDTTN